jgi:hypothetical protein
MSKNIKHLIGIFAIAIVLFYPALTTFYTHDDFFHFVASRAYNLKDFINFFNILSPATGYPHYRPLSIQLPYFLDWKFLNLDPLPLRIFSFVVFAMILFLVFRLAEELSKNKKISLLATLLYATAASHFGRLYIVAQAEPLYSLFALSSVLLFLKYLSSKKPSRLFLSVLFFVLSLLSKETAVVGPFLLILVYLFYRIQKRTGIGVKKVAVSLAPYFILLTAYFYLRFAHYGLATGDSYVWNFSPLKALNTLSWYGLWSLNLPEMLVDFVGPGLKFNPNLFKFWSKEIWPIFGLFVVQLVLLIYGAIKLLLSSRKKLFTIHYSLFTLGTSWFLIALVPVLFLPVHKFTYYLTLPLFGVVMMISYVLYNLKSKFVNLSFVAVWIILSALTLNLTADTNWITRGAQTSKNVYNFFQQNQNWLSLQQNIVFYDLPEDEDLPWSPSSVVKTSLSDNNFFEVYYPGKYEVWYGRENFQGEEAIYIGARQFLGY